MNPIKQLLAAGAAVAATVAFAPPAQAADDAQVSILHGVPDAVVDVYAPTATPCSPTSSPAR